MKIERSQVTMLTITDAPRLDPMRVVIENYEPGRGRITIQCYDRAWVAFWGAMGCSLERFFVSCNWEYIAEYLTCGLHGLRKNAMKHERQYLQRIIEAVQAALREHVLAKEGSESNG